MDVSRHGRDTEVTQSTEYRRRIEIFFPYFGPFLNKIREMNPPKFFFQIWPFPVAPNISARLMKETRHIKWRDPARLRDLAADVAPRWRRDGHVSRQGIWRDRVAPSDMARHMQQF